MNIFPWIKAARIKTLVASIVPVLGAITILPESNKIHVPIFLLTIRISKNIYMYYNIPHLICHTLYRIL